MQHTALSNLLDLHNGIPTPHTSLVLAAHSDAQQQEQQEATLSNDATNTPRVALRSAGEEKQEKEEVEESNAAKPSDAIVTEPPTLNEPDTSEGPSVGPRPAQPSLSGKVTKAKKPIVVAPLPAAAHSTSPPPPPSEDHRSTSPARLPQFTQPRPVAQRTETETKPSKRPPAQQASSKQHTKDEQKEKEQNETAVTTTDVPHGTSRDERRAGEAPPTATASTQPKRLARHPPAKQIGTGSSGPSPLKQCLLAVTAVLEEAKETVAEESRLKKQREQDAQEEHRQQSASRLQRAERSVIEEGAQRYPAAKRRKLQEALMDHMQYGSPPSRSSPSSRGGQQRLQSPSSHRSSSPAHTPTVSSRTRPVGQDPNSLATHSDGARLMSPLGRSFSFKGDELMTMMESRNGLASPPSPQSVLTRRNSMPGTAPGSPAASIRRRSSVAAMLSSDLPEGRDVSQAFEEAKAHFRQQPFRLYLQPTLFAPAPLLDFEKRHNAERKASGTTTGQRSDALLKQTRTMIHNAVLLCRACYDVSQHSEAFERSVMDMQPALIPAEVSMGQFLRDHTTTRSSTTSQTEQEEGEELMDLMDDSNPLTIRQYGTVGSVKWFISSFNMTPSALMVTVSSDACGNEFVEFPGTGRAGLVKTCAVVFGSAFDTLVHEAETTMLTEGMMGLEYAERLRIEHQGPMVLQHSYVSFTEEIARLIMERQWYVQLERLLNGVRRSLYQHAAAVAAQMSHAPRGAPIRFRRGYISTLNPNTVTPFHKISFRAEHTLALQAALGAHIALRKRYFGTWRSLLEARRSVCAMFSAVPESLDTASERNDGQEGEASRPSRNVAQDVDLHLWEKHQKADLLESRLRARSLREAYHVFSIGCFRRKVDRYQKVLMASATNKREVVLHETAARQAKKLVDALRPVLQQLRPTEPLTFAGHSTGGAIALVAACLLSADTSLGTVGRVITFGAPKAFRLHPSQLLKELAVHHVPVALVKDPCVQQPWSFEHNVKGLFVAKAGGELAPTAWAEHAPIPSASRYHWIAHHAIEAYVENIVPHAVFRGDRPRNVAELEQLLIFESQMLAPSPPRGASHGFSLPMMKGLQHIASRYGVGIQQKLPREFLLSVCAQKNEDGRGTAGSNQSSNPRKAVQPPPALHLITSRMPVGQGGRLDQPTFVSWLWAEGLIDTKLIWKFFRHLTYAFNGHDFLPTQKALIEVHPIPKALPLTALFHAEEGHLTTAGRAAVAHVFSLHARIIPLSPLEYRLTQNTLLMSRHCVAQFLEEAEWSQRCSAASAVQSLMAQVAAEHVANVVEESRMPPREGRRLSLKPLPATLMSFSGELTERGFIVLMSALARDYGVTALQHALWNAGYNGQWVHVVTRRSTLTPDIHWMYGPCWCLREDSERSRQNALERNTFSKWVSERAVLIRSSAARSNSVVQQQQQQAPMPGESGSAGHNDLSVDWRGAEGGAPLPSSPAAGPRSTVSQRHRLVGVADPDELPLHSGPRSPPLGDSDAEGATGTTKRLRTPSFVFTDTDDEGLLPEPARDKGQGPDVPGSLAVVSVVESPVPSARANSAVQGSKPLRVRGPAAAYGSSTTQSGRHSAPLDVPSWEPTLNYRKMRRDQQKELKRFLAQQASVDTSVGSKPKHRPPPQVGGQLSRAAIRSLARPSTNSEQRVSAMYSTGNTLRLYNKTQRKILHLPALRNELLEPRVVDEDSYEEL